MKRFHRRCRRLCILAALLVLLVLFLRVGVRIAFGDDTVRLPEVQDEIDVRHGVHIHQHHTDATRRRDLVDASQTPTACQVAALVDIQERLDGF